MAEAEAVVRADWIHNLTSDNNSATKGKNQDDEKGNGVEHESGIKS